MGTITPRRDGPLPLVFEVEYGRVEARIRVPSGQGVWPAFWMLGGDFQEVGWPDCGEIDILEVRGKEPDRLIGSVHGPGYSAGNAISAVYEHPESLADDFHVYAIEWSPGRIDWYLDDTMYHSRFWCPLYPMDRPGF